MKGGFGLIFVYMFGFLTFIGIAIYIAIKGYTNPEWLEKDHQKHRAGFEVIFVASIFIGIAVLHYLSGLD